MEWGCLSLEFTDKQRPLGNVGEEGLKTEEPIWDRTINILPPHFSLSSSSSSPPPSKLAASFQSMEVRNSNFADFIDIFTSNTYVMVVMSDPSIRKLEREQGSSCSA